MGVGFSWCSGWVGDEDGGGDGGGGEPGCVLGLSCDGGSEVDESGLLVEELVGLWEVFEGLDGEVDELDELSGELLGVAVGVEDVEECGDGSFFACEGWGAEGGLGDLFGVEVDGEDGHLGGALEVGHAEVVVLEAWAVVVDGWGGLDDGVGVPRDLVEEGLESAFGEGHSFLLRVKVGVVSGKLWVGVGVGALVDGREMSPFAMALRSSRAALASGVKGLDWACG